MTYFHDPNASDKLRKASELILESFQWYSSPEGQDYWQNIRNKLLEMSKDAASKESCNQEIAALKKRIAEIEDRCRG
jgi:hypothetical protein